VVTSAALTKPLITTATSATFTQLPPGRHVFTVIAQSEVRSGPPAASNLVYL
jgi:hypothetical protein